MGNFTVEKYKIIDVEQIRLKDEEGEYWYPLKNFLNHILFRGVKSISGYRDNEEYSKYLKVIEYIPLQTKTGLPVKTWFMNTEGMFILLQKARIREDSDSPKITYVKNQYLAAARNFFGVTQTQTETDYLSYAPDLSNYDVWSIMCLKQDTQIDSNTLWKRCKKCGFYYPMNKRYFNKLGTKYSNNCRQCLGIDFICENKNLQYLYSHDGLDLIYQFYIQEDNNKIANELKKWIRKGGI